MNDIHARALGYKDFTPFVKKFVFWPVLTSDGWVWCQRVYTRKATSPFGDEHFTSFAIYYTDEEVTLTKLRERA